MAKHKNEERAERTNSGSAEGRSILPVLLIALLAGMIIVNQYMIYTIVSGASASGASAAGATSTGLAVSGSNNANSGVLPAGVPAIYGRDMGISFDDVSANNPQKADATIKKLGAYDNSITLSGDKLQRYITIGSQISCEYCCGAESIIFPDGSAACGCAHSYAMRGLAKYLLQNHADQYTDDQILEELGKWKTLFFPGKMIAKADVLKQKGIPFNYINLASNKYRGIEQGAASGGGMVGGC